MSTHQLVLSPAAQEDIRETYRFGLRHWGANQASKYLEKLKEHLWTLAEEPLIGRKRPELFPELRCFPIESHIVFYQVRPPKVEIIRVLHGRQDPNQHLGQDKGEQDQNTKNFSPSLILSIPISLHHAAYG